MIGDKRRNSITRFLTALAVCGLVLTSTGAVADDRLRSDVEAELPPIETAYLASPGDDAVRRDYATVLYELGDVWQANDVIAPLATPSSSNIDDLKLGSRLAYLVGDYGRAEVLYKRLTEIAARDSEAYADAVEGLGLVYIQTDRFSRARDLEPPADPPEGEDDGSDTLEFIQKFEGEPNQIEWATPEKVAHLPMINDYTQPGVLPLFSLEVNGHPVEFILDTGGGFLYIDEGRRRKGRHQAHPQAAVEVRLHRGRDRGRAPWRRRHRHHGRGDDEERSCGRRQVEGDGSHQRRRSSPPRCSRRFLQHRRLRQRRDRTSRAEQSRQTTAPRVARGRTPADALLDDLHPSHVHQGQHQRAGRIEYVHGLGAGRQHADGHRQRDGRGAWDRRSRRSTSRARGTTGFLSSPTASAP